MSGTPRPVAAALIVVTAAIIGTLLHQSASPSPPSSGDARADDRHGKTIEPHGIVPEPDGVVDEDDGVVPDGVTVFDDEHPAVANLDPDLLQAVRDAATDAADDGIELYVNSGWRSPEYQDQLLREAVAEHGSAEQAARWVATADTSAHVSGDAIDIGHVDARAWLAEHGAEYGLCQTYANEPWHYELRPGAIDHGCPATYPDPTHDPRLYGDAGPSPAPSRRR